MTQYIVLIHNDAGTAPGPEEWEGFCDKAGQSGMFRGGSEIGEREVIGGEAPVQSSDHIAGYMRFDADDRRALLDLLKAHPVVVHGGTVELCVMPES